MLCQSVLQSKAALYRANPDVSGLDKCLYSEQEDLKMLVFKRKFKLFPVNSVEIVKCIFSYFLYVLLVLNYYK